MKVLLILTPSTKGLFTGKATLQRGVSCEKAGYECSGEDCATPGCGLGSQYQNFSFAAWTIRDLISQVSELFNTSDVDIRFAVEQKQI